MPAPLHHEEPLTVEDLSRSFDEHSTMCRTSRMIYAAVASVVIVVILGSGTKIILDGERIAKLEAIAISCPPALPDHHRRP